MSNDMRRAYREASVQIRATAEQNGVSLSGRDVDKIARQYGLRRASERVAEREAARMSSDAFTAESVSSSARVMQEQGPSSFGHIHSEEMRPGELSYGRASSTYSYYDNNPGADAAMQRRRVEHARESMIEAKRDSSVSPSRPIYEEPLSSRHSSGQLASQTSSYGSSRTDVTTPAERYRVEQMRRNAFESKQEFMRSRMIAEDGAVNSSRVTAGDTDRILDKIHQDAGNGELLARCHKQSEVSLKFAGKYDDIDRLQRFARMHNKTELTAVQAEAILKSHKDLLTQSPSQISSAITKFKTGSALKTGGQAALRVATVVTGIVTASNNEEGSGVDTQGTTGTVGDIAREAGRKKFKEKRLEAKRAEAKAKARGEYNQAHSPKTTGRTSADAIKKTPSPRQNKAMGTTARNGSKVTKTRGVFATTDVKGVQEARAAQKAQTLQSVRRKRTVSNLIGKKKAKEKAAQGAKSGFKAAMSKFAEGSASSSSSSSLVAGIKYVLIVFLCVVLIYCILLCAIAMFVVVILGSGTKGDWYDSQYYDYTNFVTVTQDLQRKYYDDCLMLAYKSGADTPSYEDVEINWDEVYALWSAIVKYRSGNKNMEKVFSDSSGKHTGYSEGAAVFDLKNNVSMMFTGANRDYVHDFYLAFYSMYYDMKALDDHGNPVIINIFNDERFVPYYPKISDTEYNYKYFCASNGYPLIGDITHEVVTNVIYLNDDYEWCINDAWKDRCYFAYASTLGIGNDGGSGCFNRGLPKVRIETEDITETYTPDPYDVDVSVKYYMDWDGDGNCKPTAHAVYNAFSGDDWSYDDSYGGTWSIRWVEVDYGDGNGYERVYGDEADEAVDETGGYIYFGSGICSSMQSGCDICAAVGDGEDDDYDEDTEHYHHGYYLYAGTMTKTVQPDDIDVDIVETRMILPNPTALDGFEELHDAYTDLKFYDARTGPYDLAGHHVISGQRVVEAGTKAKSTAIAVVLNQIFDRSPSMPWDPAEKRWSDGTSSGMYACGLPEASNASHDCSSYIRNTLNGIRSSMLTNGTGLPNSSSLHASIDSGSDGKLGYSSIYEMMLASVSNAQYTFPFYVTRSRWDPDEGWRRGDIVEDDSEAYNVLSFTRGKQEISWTSTTYLMYRYLMAEQELCSPAICGVLGALQTETQFKEGTYGAIVKDNGVNVPYAYALGLLQWNDDIEWRDDHTNLYENRLPKWCLENGYNWRNAGAQLHFLDYLFENESKYAAGIQGCQNVGSLPYPDTIGDSGYYKTGNFPTYSAAESAACYESCWYWGVNLERGIEQVGGTYNDDYYRSGYGPIENLFGLDGGVHSKSSGAQTHPPEPNIEKQRMVAAHIFLRYVAGSDPNYCPLITLTNE